MNQTQKKYLITAIAEAANKRVSEIQGEVKYESYATIIKNLCTNNPVKLRPLEIIEAVILGALSREHTTISLIGLIEGLPTPEEYNEELSKQRKSITNRQNLVKEKAKQLSLEIMFEEDSKSILSKLAEFNESLAEI